MNQQLPSVQDLLSGAGGYETAFKAGTPVGTVVAGTITKVDTLQVRNYETGDPEFWAEGEPKMQMRIVVNTGVLDPSIDGDTGERAIYVKWWGDQRNALLEAVRQAGAKSIDEGGKFAAKFLSTKPTESKNNRGRLADAKVFGYQYQPPVAGVDLGADLAGSQPQQQQAQQGFQHPQNPPQQVQQQAPVQQQDNPWGNQPPAQPQQQAPVQDQQAAAQQAFQQGLQAEPVQQQAAPAPQPAAAPQQDDPTARARQLLPLGFTDEQIEAATGVPAAQVKALRG